MFMKANVENPNENVATQATNFNASEFHALLFDIVNLLDVSGDVLLNDLDDRVQDKVFTLVTICKDKAEKALQVFEDNTSLR